MTSLSTLARHGLSPCQAKMHHTQSHLNCTGPEATGSPATLCLRSRIRTVAGRRRQQQASEQGTQETTHKPPANEGGSPEARPAEEVGGSALSVSGTASGPQVTSFHNQALLQAPNSNFADKANAGNQTQTCAAAPILFTVSSQTAQIRESMRAPSPAPGPWPLRRRQARATLNARPCAPELPQTWNAAEPDDPMRTQPSGCALLSLGHAHGAHG